PVRRARGDGNEPGVHAIRSINFHAMFHGIVGPRHFLLQAESPEQLASFAGHRFADMEAGKRFLFQHDWLNSFAEKEHCCGRTTGPATNYEHIGFRIQGVSTKTTRKALESKEDFLTFLICHRPLFIPSRYEGGLERMSQLSCL